MEDILWYAASHKYTPIETDACSKEQSLLPCTRSSATRLLLRHCSPRRRRSARSVRATRRRRRRHRPPRPSPPPAARGAPPRGRRARRARRGRRCGAPRARAPGSRVGQAARGTRLGGGAGETRHITPKDPPSHNDENLSRHVRGLTRGHEGERGATRRRRMIPLPINDRVTVSGTARGTRSRSRGRSRPHSAPSS